MITPVTKLELMSYDTLRRCLKVLHGKESWHIRNLSKLSLSTVTGSVDKYKFYSNEFDKIKEDIILVEGYLSLEPMETEDV